MADPSFPVELAGEPYAYLTTRGRRSGRDREIEIWFAAGEHSVYLISGGGERTQWPRNLLADPGRARVRVGERSWRVRPRLPLGPGEERDRAARSLHAKYAGQVSSTVETWLESAYLVALDLLEELRGTGAATGPTQ